MSIFTNIIKDIFRGKDVTTEEASKYQEITLKTIFEELKRMKDEDLDSPTEDNEVIALRWYEKNTIEAYEEITQSSSLDRKKKQKIIENSISEYHTRVQRYGSLWTFVYEAESDRLKYWDRMPLVLRMIDNKDDPNSFLGINLHYLYPRYRKILLVNLMTKLNTDVSDSEARILGLNMQRLSNFPNKYGRLCIRRYKYDNIRRKPIRIPPEHWLKMIFLPTYHFVGARPAKVWGKTYEIMKKMGLTKGR